MKKTLLVLFTLFLLVGLLLAEDKVKVERPVSDRDPNASNHSNLMPPTDDLFDLQFEWPVGVGGGEAGLETDGTYMYTSKWNGTTFYRYAMDGTYIEEFSVAGCPGGIRDLAYDGQYFYGAAADNTVYEMDFDAMTVISTINAPIAVRAIAYDEVSDGFWGNNWSDQITLFDRTGTTLNSFPCGTWISYYGFAWENVNTGGPYLWGYSQAGNGNQLVQIEIATGLETGVNFDVGSVTAVGTGIAGGLCISDAFVPGMWTIAGTSQNVNIWGLELGVAADPAAPGAPTDLIVTAGAVGALEALIGWTCPTLQVDGNPLTDLDEMRVYRDGVLIYTDPAPAIGGPGTYTDFPTAAGQYNYSVVGYNDLGEGIPAAMSVWVGEDTPGPVTDLTLTDISAGGVLEAQLDWLDPVVGVHGGYFSGVTGYDITRSDGVEFLNIPGPLTQWTDLVPAAGVYSYTVEPYNASGYGPPTTSPQVGIGVSIVQVGNAESTDYQIPMNIYYDNSIVECVYDMEWLGTDMLINAVSFHAANIGSTINDFDFEIWLGEVDIDDLSGGFIDATQLTMVFDGTISVPTGDYWLELPLDTPFEYTYSHNLVMGTVKDDDEWYSSSDTWWCTESGTANRTIHQYNDTTEYSIQNPPTTTSPKTTYPDVRFTYSVLAHGDVEGVVTNSATSNPIDGAEVYVGNWGPVTTNALGEYLVEGIVTGLQPVTVTKDGYYDFFGEVDVIADVVVTYDIAMDPNLFGIIDGTVTDADTGDPLVGAAINVTSLAGYTYDGITDDTGYYEILDVVAETYDVSCSFPDYPTGLVVDVVVEDGLTTTVDFVLAGYTYWNDFETNDGGLISDNASGWQWGAFTSGPMAGYSGTNGWGTVIGGDYPSNSNFTLDTPAPFFMVEPNGMLEFWHWYDIENSWDGGNVKISTDGGGTWNVIVPLGGYSGLANASNPLNGEEIFCGTLTGWELVEFDLSAYQGQSVMFRWHFGSDSSVNYPGWYIDDVSVSGGEVPEQGSLVGTVVEFGTGTPIEGAVVSIVGSGLSATTLADGTYEILDIWPGSYDILCESPFYLTSEELGFDIIGAVNTLDISMLWSEISVDVVTLDSYLPPDETEVQTFTITNNGPGDLEYNISFEYPEAISVRQMTINKGQAAKTTANQKALPETRSIMSSDRDETPYVSKSTTELSREMWDLQFSFDVTAATGAAGNAGCEFDGTYFYTTRWASNLIHKFDIDGNLIEEFSIPGVSGLRDLAYDGTHFYGGAAGNVIYEMDFETQTLIGTINSSVAARAIAYNEDLDAFFVSNFADPVGLIGHDGTTIATFDCGLSGTYGFAYDNLTDGGPYLWLFDQGAGGGSPQLIHQMDALTYTMTGVTHDVSLELPDPSGIAGGLFLTTDFVPGIVTLGGLQQGVPDQVFCYELAPYSTWVAATANSSGTVPGNGGTILVEVTFDATDLLIGDFLEADLLIHNNANYVADGDDYVIPVSLTITGFIPPANLFVDEATALFTWDAPPGPNLLGYNIFLDDMTTSIGTTTATEWQYDISNLTVGQEYIAGVSAVYDDGESQVQEYTFTYEPDNAGNIIPLVTELRGNFPNPFNPDTKIAFSLNKQSHVQITIFNIKGQLVKTLIDEERDANNYTVIWNGTDNSSKPISSGVYFYKMKAADYTATRKMIMMK